MGGLGWASEADARVAVQAAVRDGLSGMLVPRGEAAWLYQRDSDAAGAKGKPSS